MQYNSSELAMWFYTQKEKQKTKNKARTEKKKQKNLPRVISSGQ